MRIIAPTITRIAPSKVVVPEGRRPLNAEKLKQLTDSMSRIGLVQPISVHIKTTGARPRLVAGHHRLAAAIALNWDLIDAVLLPGNDLRMRLAEIAENLHRAELTALERDELLAEWIRLTEPVSSQPETKLQGGRPAGGVNAAARELGVSKADAHRAVKTASLTPEAKAVATEVGLADNRSALLAAAKETDPTKQVEALKTRAQRKPSPSTKTPIKNPLAEAWRSATQTQRREFALSYRTEIMFAQQRGGLAGPTADRAEAVRLAADRAEAVAAQRNGAAHPGYAS